jgi:hypothetical protein
VRRLEVISRAVESIRRRRSMKPRSPFPLCCSPTLHLLHTTPADEANQEAADEGDHGQGSSLLPPPAPENGILLSSVCMLSSSARRQRLRTPHAAARHCPPRRSTSARSRHPLAASLTPPGYLEAPMRCRLPPPLVDHIVRGR